MLIFFYSVISDVAWAGGLTQGEGKRGRGKPNTWICQYLIDISEFLSTAGAAASSGSTSHGIFRAWIISSYSRGLHKQALEPISLSDGVIPTRAEPSACVWPSRHRSRSPCTPRRWHQQVSHESMTLPSLASQDAENRTPLQNSLA